MRLVKIFLDGLAKQGNKKSEIRILDVESQLLKEMNKMTISDYSKKYNFNSGSLSAMLKGKRAIPLNLLKETPKKFRCILTGSNMVVTIPNDLSEDLSYIVGLLRDGTVDADKNGEYTCALYNKNKKFLEKIKLKVDKLFEVNTQIQKFGDCYGVRIRSKTLYMFFKIVFEFENPQMKWNTPTLIMRSDDKIKRDYISGFFDAEGGVPHLENMKAPKRKNLYVKFVQKNKESLEFIKTHLMKIGIETGKVYWSENKNNLKVKMSSINLFVNYINSLHPEKANRLEMLSRLLRAL